MSNSSRRDDGPGHLKPARRKLNRSVGLFAMALTCMIALCMFVASDEEAVSATEFYAAFMFTGALVALAMNRVLKSRAEVAEAKDPGLVTYRGFRRAVRLLCEALLLLVLTGGAYNVTGVGAVWVLVAAAILVMSLALVAGRALSAFRRSRDADWADQNADDPEWR